MLLLTKLIPKIIVVLLVILFFQVIEDCSALYKGPSSDHFDGRRFFNKEPGHTLIDTLKWLWEMETVEWPEWVDDPEQPLPVPGVGTGSLRVTFINHSTVLIQIDSLNILTDPIWSFRAGPFRWAGSKRVRAPGVKMSDLPKIDIIIISHDHYDHLDISTLKKLKKSHDFSIFAGLGIRKILRSNGFTKIIEMDWWQKYTHEQSRVNITFVPSLHNSGRNLFFGNRTLWGGFVIQGSSGNVYFAGDTAYGQFLHQIKRKFNNFRLAIFPVGNYEKRWYMKSQHMNPDDAVRAHKLLKVKQSVGIHFSTFVEHPEQTIDAHEKDLLRALKKHHVSESKFWLLKFGEGRDVPK